MLAGYIVRTPGRSALHRIAGDDQAGPADGVGTRLRHRPGPANSWLPFTGDLDLRAAVSDFTAARAGRRFDPEREIVITSGGMEGLLDAALALIDPDDEVVVTDPTYAGIVNRVRRSA